VGGADWPKWLCSKLAFPFTVTREEDEDDAYFRSGRSERPRSGWVTRWRLSAWRRRTWTQGMIVKVKEKNRTGFVPLCDVEVRPKTDKNYWPVREYVVWFANRC